MQAPADDRKQQRRRWIGQLAGGSSSGPGGQLSVSQYDTINPPGYLADWDAAPSSSRGAGARRPREVDAEWKEARAWETAQAPVKNLLMMAFMMWMAGSTVHIFSIGIVFSVLWQPLAALRTINAAFKPFEDPKASLVGPKLVFVALNLAAMALGLWKLNTLGLLPTKTSDWISQLPPREVLETSVGVVIG